MALFGQQTASSTLLSTSTLSALSNSSSLLDGVDVDIIEEIIERAPRSAATFPPIHRAYGLVLEEHGLNPIQDSKYYNFLLKLGVIRAVSWGEKWDLFQATQGAHQVRVQPPPRRARAYAPSIARRLRADKTKLPFLASASSDLDEGFEPSHEGDIESLLGLACESPRKAMGATKEHSRSLVGHTPSHSLDHAFDALSMNPPIRTSTPVYAQYHHGSHVNGDDADADADTEAETSPGLPPYSVSDVSHGLDMTMPSNPSTPRPRHFVLGPDMMEKWDARTEREMEALADEFHRLGLMGRCLDVWSRAFDWIRSTTDQIDSVRNKILLRRVLQKWSEACEYQLSLPATADRHRQLYLRKIALERWVERVRVKKLERAAEGFVLDKEEEQVKRAWKRWRIEVTRRRTERWQREVGKKERLFVRKRNALLVTNTFDMWYDSARDRRDGRIADQHFVDRTQRTILSFWIKRTALSHRLGDLLRAKEEDEMAQAFAIWRRNVRLADAEREIHQKRIAGLLQSTWEMWSEQRVVQSKARQFDQQRLRALAFERWVERKRRLDSLRRKAEKYHRGAVLRYSMRVWVTCERAQLYARVRDVRLVQNAFKAWSKRADDIRHREDMAIQLAEDFARAAVHRTFSRWRARVGDEHQRHLRAVLYHESLENKGVKRAFETWRAAADRVKANQITAVKARAFFAQRLALRVWRNRLVVRRQEAWVEERRLNELRQAFAEWRFRFTQRRQEDQILEVLWAKQDQRLVSLALTTWTQRVIEIKSREHDVLRQRHAKLERDALARWIMAARRVKAATELMQSFAQVRMEDHLRAVLLAWRNKAVRLRTLNRTVEVSLIQRQEQLLATAFGRWRDAYRERTLAGVEQEVALRSEDALLFAVWDRWKERSTRLPEIAFIKKRLLRYAWAKWRDAIEMRVKERSITMPRDQQLLLDVFAVWREATRRQIALNAVRRRGRVRPGMAPPDAPRRVSMEMQRPGTSCASTPSAAPAYAYSAARPDNSHRRATTHLPTPSTAATRSRGLDVESTNSEPAYSRLRSELYGRKRGGSEEPMERGDGAGTTSELVRQLRGALR